MPFTHGDTHPRSSNDAVIAWLLDTDPSIRWQVMRDLTDTPAEIVAVGERHWFAAPAFGPGLDDSKRWSRAASSYCEMNSPKMSGISKPAAAP